MTGTELFIHPSILFIAGAFLIPFLWGNVRKVFLLLIPALALIIVASTAQGTYGSFEFLGREIIFGKVDGLSLVFSYVFTIVAFIGMVYSLHVEDVSQHSAAFFYIGSSLGVVFAGDFAVIFIFWEIMAFASAYLIFAQRDAASVKAAFRYILMHIFGGVCLLGGIVLHYADYGSTLFGPLQQDGSLGFYLILIGFILNAAVPPLHSWLPDAYPEATITGAVFMSAFTTKTAVYVLIRAFPGTELLVWMGTIMAVYGVFYATLQDNMRRLLSYHIVSQVGYMVAGIGLGSQLALNGSVSHAFTHILYKGLLFMGTGSVMFMTGKRRLSELGGLYKYMPITMLLYMIAGFSISAFPLFSGFVSKSMIIAAANHDHRAIIVLLLTLTSAGTFLSTTLKLPYFAFFGKDSGIKAKEPPINMLIGMGIAAFLCVAIGIFPDPLYNVLPFPVDFEPYTGDHVTSSLGILLFTALGFFLLIKKLKPAPHITLDTDWFYRKGTLIFMWFARKPVGAYEGFITEIANTAIMPFIYAVARLGFRIDRNIVDKAVNGVAGIVMSLSAGVRRVQTGQVQHYAIGMVLGIMVIIFIFSVIVRG